MLLLLLLLVNVANQNYYLLRSLQIDNNPSNMQQNEFFTLIPTILALYPDYRTKIQHLFQSQQKQVVSQKHLTRGIITNPKAIFNLIQSNFLKEFIDINYIKYIELKSEVLQLVKHLIDNFTLNAKFIYEDALLVIQNNCKINIVTYLVKDINNIHLKLKKTTNQEEKKLYKNYIHLCTSIFYLICSVCTLRTSELKLITNNLTQFYYQQQMSTSLIAHCLRLLDAGLQERNISPYLYFIDNNKNDSVRVLFTNNKWPFSKGMTVFMWLNALKSVDCRLLWIKTQDNNELILKVVKQKIVLQCQNKDNLDNSSLEICDFPLNTIVALCIQLEPTNQGLFKSTTYNLNININGIHYKNVTNKIPKFQSNEFITQFSFLNSFIGNLYNIIITAKPQLSVFDQVTKFSQYGICRESLVWSLIENKLLKTQSILCIFNPERYFQGLLLNYVSSKNHACFEGRVSSVTYHKYDSKIIEIYLPFLYFLTLIKEKDEEWGELFDLTFQHILQIISKENYEIESVMLLLFFLQMNQYRITQSTLNYLYDCSHQHSNFYINIIVKYLDVHALVERGLKIDQTIDPYDDPVQKNILLFYLETLWAKKWNSFQGFQGWWSPLFFQPQINHPFNPADFKHNPQREVRVEWSVKNLVTKDYCKCFIEPIFKIPASGQLHNFREEYKKKQCFQDFKVKLYHQPRREVMVCNKISNSSLDKIRNKLLGSRENIHESPKKKTSNLDIKEFSTECAYIDILTVIQGVVRITKEGFVVFTSRHKTTRFDRMCMRGHQNEEFLYLAVPLADIRKVQKKRFNASNKAVEIKTKDGQEIMFYFYRKDKQEDPIKRIDVDVFISIMQSLVKVKKDAYNNYINSQKPLQWIDKLISNYQYLQWLNQIAGRSYSDMTQYPVLPWVYVASQQKVEDLQPKSRYRDLTKNMGSQGDKDRIRHFLEKYKNEDQNQLFSQYHFGTHYSSSAIIFNFLVRIRPYSLGAITLQSGRFDVADRLFYSYIGSWNNAVSSPTDLRELIPEIYTLPELFINKNNYEYGLTQDKIPIDNVILPGWAKQNPYVFVSEMRTQLQSDQVSENINEWINLIYGHKQRGKDAVENMNIFYPLTYQNCIDLDKVTDENQLESFQTQIAHFGQNPSQIIGNNPHPKRLALKARWEQKLIGDANQLLIQKCFLSKAPLSESKYLFKSVLEGRNAIIGLKFVSDQVFLVLRKNEYCVFEILSKQSNFLSKQQEIKFELQSIQVSLNYKQLSTVVPIASIQDQIVIVGGFYNGNVQIIFMKENKYNRSFKFPTSTITALQYHPTHHILYVGDTQGYLRVYHVAVTSRFIEFQQKKMVKSHDSKINGITLNVGANLITLCSQDGSVSIYNSYSIQIMRTIRHPTALPITFAHITTNPLYGVVFYSNENSTVYVYSINGQFLDSFCEKTGFIYNMSIVKGTNSAQSLVYLNAHREMYIFGLPILKLKRKVKVKKDDSRVSCFQTCGNSKIAIAGTEDGALQLVADPSSY